MGRMIAYGITIVGSFALAAGGSWYLNQEPAAEGDEQAATDAENPDSNTTVTGAHEETDANAPQVTAQPVPSAVPPRSMSAEDLYRVGEMMKSREAAISRREKTLETEDRRITLIMRDIDAEQQETDGLFTQVRGTLESAAQMLEQLRDENERLSATKTELTELAPNDDTENLSPADELKNLKKMSTTYQSMDPNIAAAKLTSLADEGQIDMVVAIINQFEERKAAKVLEAITDEALSVQIAQKFAKLRHPEKKAGRR